MHPELLKITVDAGREVSALALTPHHAAAALVLGHGAGAGMTHAFMQALAEALATNNVATLRYQFPYMEAGSRRPDPPALCHRTVRAAVDRAGALWPALPLFAGGKSFGGRMTSQAQAAEPLAAVRGLVFFGFPLHPAGKPSSNRADHLGEIACPQLFLQGDRDTLADLALLRPIIASLPQATLHVVAHADHAFHVPVKSGSTDEAVLQSLAQTSAGWCKAIAAGVR